MVSRNFGNLLKVRNDCFASNKKSLDLNLSFLITFKLSFVCFVMFSALKVMIY